MTSRACGRCGAPVVAARPACGQCGAPVTQPMPTVAAAPTPLSSVAFDEEAELNKTRVRRLPAEQVLEEKAAPPATALAVAASSGAPDAPQVVPPFASAVAIGVPSPLSSRNAELPSVGWTVAITALFGLFGTVPASMHARRARELGESGTRYWKAFWWTFAIGIVLSVLLTVALMLALLGAMSSSSGMS